MVGFDFVSHYEKEKFKIQPGYEDNGRMHAMHSKFEVDKIGISFFYKLLKC
jgi:hypothetical protein